MHLIKDEGRRVVRKKRMEDRMLCKEVGIFHLFNCITHLRLKPATGIGHRAYVCTTCLRILVRAEGRQAKAREGGKEERVCPTISCIPSV